MKAVAMLVAMLAALLTLGTVVVALDALGKGDYGTVLVMLVVGAICMWAVT